MKGKRNEPIRSDSPWTVVLRRLIGKRLAVVCFFVFVIICLACVAAPLLTPHDYSTINKNSVQLNMLSPGHILGTDNLGRDLFSRLLYGGRVTLKIALGSTAIAAFFGSVIGLLAGYFGNKTDFFISRLLDMLASIPVFLLILVTECALGWGQGYFLYALAIAAMPQFGRLVRACVMSIMGNEYIEAARALGVSHTRIILKHVLHNVAPPLIVRITSGVAEALMLCTIMGYLSVGINPPTPEWGAIVHTGKAYIRMHPQLMIIPCVVIVISVISLSLFGDGLRDALDPKDGAQKLSGANK